ncbi:MAG TPA: biotin--[acetyl-CoA-carboxylase] ligase [Chitinophagaceae bacterium]|nr:biotin--[acetyl-CoA-carboxylase] ligase [Chitinophagaceae bacterium]
MPATEINNPIGVPFIEIYSLDSTNNYAMQQLQKSMSQHGTAYFAHEQFAGKGQRGKQWHARPGENIILSVVLDTSYLQVSKQFGLSMAVAMATHDFFAQRALKDTFVKWPNDLYWGDRKAGGILIENIIRGKDWQWAIAGIGININQTIFDPSITNAVSLKQITGKTYDPVQLAKELCNSLNLRYNQLINQGTELLLIEYNAVLYKHGQSIKLKKANVSFNAILKEVNEYGQLVVEASAEQTFNVGEIEWVVI